MVELSEHFTRLAQAVKPSVVYVEVQSATPVANRGPQIDPRTVPPQFRDFFRDQPDSRGEDMPPRPRQSAGSGWVFDAQGHIVTNAHVVENAQSITVVFADNTRVEADVVGQDPQTDIAVLKLSVLPDNLTPAARSVDHVRQGEIVFAFGSPFRYRFSMSQGIVSGLGRETGILGREGYEDFIQTDAAINPGNSGGPLTDVRGRVVGMNTAIFSRTGSFAGIGFAIPLPVIESVVPQLIGTGEVSRGQLGAFISDDPKLLKSFGVRQGVVLHDVLPDSAARAAGLQAGDVITHMDGQPARSANSLRTYIASQRPGSDIRLTVIRESETFDIDVTLGGQLHTAADPQEATADSAVKPADLMQSLGILSYQALDLSAARKRGFTTPGVLLERLRANSPAAQAGLRPGSVITHVQHQAVATGEQLARALEAAPTRDVRLRVAAKDTPTGFIMITKPE